MTPSLNFSREISLHFDSSLNGFGCEMRIMTLEDYCNTENTSVKLCKYKSNKFSKFFALTVLFFFPIKFINLFKNVSPNRSRHVSIGVFWHSVFYSKYKLDYLDLVDCHSLHFIAALKKQPSFLNLMKFLVLGSIERKLVKSYLCFFNGVHDVEYYKKRGLGRHVISVPNTKYWVVRKPHLNLRTIEEPRERITFGNLADFTYKNNITSLAGIQSLSSSLEFPHDILLAGKKSVEAATRLGINNVKAMGFLDDTDCFFQAIDIVVIPMEFGTGIPNKYLEALMTSKFIICSNYIFDCIPDMREGYGVFRYSDINQLNYELKNSSEEGKLELQKKRFTFLHEMTADCEQSVKKYILGRYGH